MDPALAVAIATPHDFSLIGLFMQADPVVKGVMLLLVFASVGCWAVILDKAVRLRRARREAATFEARIRSGIAARPEIEAAGAPAAIVAAGLREWRDHGSPGDGAEESRAERRERIERAMRAAAGAELRRLEPGLPFLATVGSAAPFIGLFGTVWGIMNSFQSIAQSQDTSLAVVAPGIAEALFATAVGLVAAIPAVIAYNKLSVELSRLAQRLFAGIAELGNALARRPNAASPTGVRLQEAAE